MDEWMGERERGMKRKKGGVWWSDIDIDIDGNSNSNSNSDVQELRNLDMSSSMRKEISILRSGSNLSYLVFSLGGEVR